MFFPPKPCRSKIKNLRKFKKNDWVLKIMSPNEDTRYMGTQYRILEIEDHYAYLQSVTGAYIEIENQQYFIGWVLYDPPSFD